MRINAIGLKIMSLLAALLLVTACETTDATSGSASSTGGKLGGVRPGVTGTELKNPNAKPGSVEDFVDNVGDRVFFAFNASDISDEGRSTLDRQADWLKAYPNVSLTIEGHCDERGTREYNLALGQRRASAVKEYLVAAGVPADRLETVSYGKERPAAEGHDEDAWAQNRRGVSVIK